MVSLLGWKLEHSAHLICLPKKLELLLGSLVAGVLVRVALSCFDVVGFLDVCG